MAKQSAYSKGWCDAVASVITIVKEETGWRGGKNVAGDTGAILERVRLLLFTDEALAVDESRSSVDSAREGAWMTAAEKLLATLHGDGGHYTQEHGVERATKDAIEKWADLQRALDEAQHAIASLRGANAALNKQVFEIATEEWNRLYRIVRDNAKGFGASSSLTAEQHAGFVAGLRVVFPQAFEESTR